LHKNSIKKIIEREWIREGVRTHTLPKNQQRHEFKALHDLRKYFQTHAQQVMNAANVELLMGHQIGLANSYYKPTQNDLLRDYIKAVPLLTINSDTVDKSVLQNQVVELKEKRQEDNYIIQGKLAVKDRQMEELKARMDIMSSNMASLMKYIATSGKSSLDLIATDIKGMSYASEEEEREEIMRMAQIARAKNKELGKVALELDNVEIRER
jgi:hypothetical protein